MFAVFDMNKHLGAAADRMLVACASAAFMALAIVTIQYDERIAPEVARAADAWGAVANDLGRRFAG